MFNRPATGESIRESSEAVLESFLVQVRPGEPALAAPQPDTSAAKTRGPEAPQSADAPADARAALVAILTPNAGEMAGSVAEQLLACVRAPDANFRGLNNLMVVRLLTRMPVGAWEALQQHALESGQGVGIRNVMLPDSVPGASALLITGLKRLPDLRSVSLAVGSQARLDLRDLRQESGRMPELELRRQRDCPLVVTVPPGTRVRGSAGFVALHKSWVAYVEPNSTEILETRTLAGQNYHHQHQGPDGVATREGQIEHSGIALNFKAEFAGAPDVSRNDRRIKCRHLALQWLADREAHQADKASPSTRRFPYGPYESADGISGHVPVETELECMRMLKSGAQSLCEAGQLGKWMSREFGRMQDGQTLRFAVGTHNHLMSLELQRKGSEYVVNFYDPNATATHQRLVVNGPAQLEGKSLDNWIGQANMKQYFGDAAGGPGLLAMFGWPADPAPPATPRTCDDTFVSAAGKSSPEYLYCSLSEGQTDRVLAGMRSALDPSQHSPAEMAAFRLQIERGFGRAMYRGHTAAMQACVAAVLQTGKDVLTADQKEAVLRWGLCCAFMWANVDLVASFVRILARTPRDVLPTQYRLLLSSFPAANKDDEDMPLLQCVARAMLETPGGPGIIRRQHHAVFALVREIASSPNMPLMTKTSLCGAMYAHPVTRTAAWSALASGNPGVAGAIACAMLEAGVDQATTKALLESLGVSLRGVFTALRQTGHWEDAEWAQRILNSLDRSGFAQVEIDGLVRDFSAKALMERRLDAIFSAPDKVLNRSLKCKEVMNHANIDLALELGEVEAARSYSKMVASVSPRVLWDGQQTALLLGRGIDGEPDAQPILSRIAAATAAGKLDPRLLARQHESIVAYLQEVLASAQLSEMTKAIVCASLHGKRSAAQTALDSQNPGAAGAMMLAILQGASEVDASQTWTGRLYLKSLGATPGAVLSALDASGDPGNRNMARTIEALLRRHGLEDLVALN